MRIARGVGALPASHLRILLYHDVPPNSIERMERQLRLLARHWRFVTPRQLEESALGGEPLPRRSLLVTFDDGLASNRVVAETLLARLGIRAVFFVLPELLEIVDREQARAFISRRILPGRSPDSLPPHLTGMSWSDLEALLDQGHTIGSHTMSHARLAGLSKADLEREVVGSGDAIAARLGASVDHFAYPFGDVGSFSALALAASRLRYRFIHSGVRGDNRPPLCGPLLRDSVSPDEPHSIVGAFVEGAADPLYRSARAKLETWGAESPRESVC